MKESFGDGKSKLSFAWKPRGDKGPTIQIETTDKAHNLIRIRSRTNSSLIVVSSASNPFSTESWTFIFNFAVETMIATRVQSNIGGVKGEVITYNCQFESLDPAMGDADNILGMNAVFPPPDGSKRLSMRSPSLYKTVDFAG